MQVFKASDLDLNLLTFLYALVLLECTHDYGTAIGLH